MIIDAIRRRRSTRFYKDKPVSDEQIEEVIKAAQFAPTAYNNRAIEFVVVRDQETKNKLFEIAKAPQNFVKEAPVLLAVVTDPAKTDHPNEDLAIAYAHIALQAVELGLGTVWKNIDSAAEEPAKVLLGVPENLRLIYLIPLGYDRDPLPEHQDEEFEKNKIHQERW
jgi:nitroreductase